MSFWNIWALFLVIFEAPVAAICILALWGGYFADTPKQTMIRGLRNDHHQNIGFIVKHGGIIGDVLWISPAMAFIVAAYGLGSDTRVVFGLLILFGLLGVPLLQVWMKEGLVTPSALGRDGYLPVEGAIHYLYMTLAFTLIVKFYFFTPSVAPRDIWIVTLLLMGHVALGVLQPVYTATGEIPKATWVIFALGETLLLVFATMRILAADHYGW